MELKQGYIQTELGLIPENWKVKRIDQVASVVGGGTPSTRINLYWEGNINWFTPTEVGYDKYLFESKRKLTNDGLKNSSANILPSGTILLTSRAGIGDLAILNIEAATNQGFQSLIANSNISNEFLYYLMLTKKNELLQNASGSTFLEISPSKVKCIKIILPPPLEQTAIATALSNIDELILKTEKLIEKKRNIKQSLIKQLLVGKRRLDGFTGNWIEKLFPQLCWYQEGPGLRNWQFTSDGIKVINVTNLVDGFLNLERTSRHISWNEFDTMYKHFEIDMDDILVASSGNSYAKVAVVRKQDLPLVMNTSVIRFKPLKDLDYYFLLAFLKSNLFKDQIDLLITGGAQPNFGPFHLNKITIKIPPTKEEQIQISSIINDAELEIEALEKKLSKSKMLKQGMMQALLTGKIRLL